MKGLEEIKLRNKEACAKHMMQRHEEAYANHHKACYGKEKLTFEWTTPEHPGIWAMGGWIKDLAPIFLGVRWVVPVESGDTRLGWWCYLGPKPEFVNEGIKHG